jgi:hypothetical protein
MMQRSSLFGLIKILFTLLVIVILMITLKHAIPFTNFDIALSIGTTLLTGAGIPVFMSMQAAAAKRQQELDDCIDRIERELAVIKSKLDATGRDWVDARVEELLSRTHSNTERIAIHEGLTFHAGAERIIAQIQGLSTRLQAQDEYKISALRDLAKRVDGIEKAIANFRG